MNKYRIMFEEYLDNSNVSKNEKIVYAKSTEDAITEIENQCFNKNHECKITSAYKMDEAY